MQVSIYFKSAIKLNDAGCGMLDEVLTYSKREGDTREQLERRIANVFGLEGRRLAAFIKRNLG